MPPTPPTRSVRLVPHDPSWAARFDALASDVRRIAADAGIDTSSLRVEHAGSTAVPGLDAKPVIDLFVGAPDVDAATRLARALDAHGWTYHPEHESQLPARRFANLDAPDGRRIANLHAWPDGDAELERHLAFRDRLRDVPADREAYERVKHELAARCADTLEYADAKTRCIREIEVRALPRMLEATVGLGTASAALELDALPDWWCSSVHELDDGRVELVVEEEYGYRRRCEVSVVPDPGRRVLSIERAEREWDGQPGATPGEPGGPECWDEPALVRTTIEMDASDDGWLTVRWRGFDVGDLDVLRREGAALTWALERARGRFDGIGARLVLEPIEVDASPDAIWDAVDRADCDAPWLGPGAWLAPSPGLPWSVGTPGGSMHGTVLHAVAGRRLVLSWRRPRTDAPATLVDVRLARCRDGGTRVTAFVDGPDGGIDEQVAAAVERLARRRHGTEG